MLFAGVVGGAFCGMSCEVGDLRIGPSAVTSCYECHIDFKDEELSAEHAAHGVTCVRCHGPSQAHMEDEVRKTPADATFRGKSQEVFCLTCHRRSKHVRIAAHKREAAKGEKRRTCTQCHGEHELVDTASPAAGKE
jgi:hypothetical protein